ncbi:MAG: hypothetical protein QM784_40010 [Polyangiaceae bacterium]
MLAIRVRRDDGLEVMTSGPEESGLQGRTLSSISLVSYDDGSCSLRLFGGSIGGTVIDDEDGECWVVGGRQRKVH